jgi:GTP-dependent phosphoenolpyruvate carboxykinase
MIQIAEPVTLEKLLPLIKKLSKVEREQLRKSLEMDSTTWQEEWENIVAYFHNAFADTPEDEVERDLDAALAEVRHERI